jgi:hypothetical protein
VHNPHAIAVLCSCPPANGKVTANNGSMNNNSNNIIIILLLQLLINFTEEVGESARFYALTEKEGDSRIT